MLLLAQLQTYFNQLFLPVITSKNRDKGTEGQRSGSPKRLISLDLCTAVPAKANSKDLHDKQELPRGVILVIANVLFLPDISINPPLAIVFARIIGNQILVYEIYTHCVGDCIVLL